MVLISLSCVSLWGVSHTRHEILGLGSAFIDYILKVSEEDLSSLRYAKGSSEPIDYTHLQALLNKHPKEIKSSSGGSCANVIKGLAKLGQRCAVLGNIGSDAHGLFYLKSLKDLDIVPFV